ncbi:MAG: hypothetical protein Q9186_005350 [Xanthomendoza sp. 1 TL-2023]
MSSHGAGFDYPPQDVAWLKRDVLLFAHSIGCTVDELHFLYVYMPTNQEVIDFYARSNAIPIPGLPKFDHRRAVDGQRLITFLKPLPSSSDGRKFELRSRVLGVYDKGKAGSVVETETVLAEKGCDEYTKAIGSTFFIGQGNWGGPKGITWKDCGVLPSSNSATGPSTTSFPPPEGREPDVVHITQTNKESAHLLNGDYNPLHATPEHGQKMGFGGAIMHGLYSWNTACHALLQSLGGSDPANMREFQARFAAPVKPGDKLVTEVWKTGTIEDDWEEIRFIMTVEGGKMVLSNGRAFMKCSSIKSHL